MSNRGSFNNGRGTSNRGPFNNGPGMSNPESFNNGRGTSNRGPFNNGPSMSNPEPFNNGPSMSNPEPFNNGAPDQGSSKHHAPNRSDYDPEVYEILFGPTVAWGVECGAHYDPQKEPVLEGEDEFPGTLEGGLSGPFNGGPHGSPNDPANGRFNGPAVGPTNPQPSASHPTGDPELSAEDILKAPLAFGAQAGAFHNPPPLPDS